MEYWSTLKENERDIGVEDWYDIPEERSEMCIDFIF